MGGGERAETPSPSFTPSAWASDAVSGARRGTYSAQYCSICVMRVGGVRGVGRRDVDGAHDPLGRAVAADVEDVDAPRRLLEAAEERALAEKRVGEDRAVHRAVRDDERGVPRGVGQEPVDRRQHAVEELTDRLPAEEALLVRDDPVQRVDERLLELVGRDRGEAVAGDLAELGPDCDLAARSDERGGLRRARQTARDDAIERRAREQEAGRLRLPPALGGERDLVGRNRPAVPVEVGDGAVPHQVDPPARGRPGRH